MHTTSFELSEKLKELGVKQHRDFYYVDHEYIVWDPDHEEAICAAYTLDEILELLPWRINEYGLYLEGKDPTDIYLIYYWNEQKDKHVGDSYLKIIDNKNPAEAAGQLLIWCIENGYVKVGEEGVIVDCPDCKENLSFIAEFSESSYDDIIRGNILYCNACRQNYFTTEGSNIVYEKYPSLEGVNNNH